MASEEPFRAHSGFEIASELLFQAHSAFKVASEQTFGVPFPAHSGFEVASEQPFRALSGFEVAQVAPVREIAVFLRRQVATKLRDPRNPRNLPTPKRRYTNAWPTAGAFVLPPRPHGGTGSLLVPAWAASYSVLLGSTVFLFMLSVSNPVLRFHAGCFRICWLELSLYRELDFVLLQEL